MYKQSSASDHGTLGFFRCKLNRTTVNVDVKKDVNATLDFFLTVVKGHLLAVACEILGITKLDSKVNLPPNVKHGQESDKSQYIRNLASQVVGRCTLIDKAITGEVVTTTDDHKYNYARTLCHYGALIMEYLDTWEHADGKRSFRCWRLFLPHFHASGRTKYSLQALCLQFQVKCVLSPQLAHEIMWHRYVNTRGGLGRNIPCDLYNEHVNKLIKQIIVNMGPNLTKEALQRSARSVSTLQRLCAQFDKTSDLPIEGGKHSTYSDAKDVSTVVSTVLSNNLLSVSDKKRQHTTFPKMNLNPLKSWSKIKCEQWIDKKKQDYLKFKGSLEEDSSGSDTDSDEH